MFLRSLVLGATALIGIHVGVAHAETVNAPSGGGVASAGPKAKTESSSVWKFIATDSPAWITDVALKSSGGGLTLNTSLKKNGVASTGGTTINASSNYSLEFTVAANTTGSTRSWTMNVTQVSSGATVWSVTVSQPSGGSGGSATGVAFIPVDVLNKNDYAWKKSFYLSKTGVGKTVYDPASSFKSGYSPYVRLAYHNVGTSEISHPKIVIEVENVKGACLGEETFTRQDTMSAGQGSIASDWELDFLSDLKAGSYVLTCTLDPDGAFVDSDLSDNVATFPFTVTDEESGEDDETLAFGPGKRSEFEMWGQTAVVAGVAGLGESSFSEEDGYGATCFADSRVTDAEKADGLDNDNYWCGPISDMNLIYLSGWASKSGLTSTYADVDDLLDYFRENPKLLRYAKTEGDPSTVVEGTYGYDGLFKWFKATTKQDLASYTKTGTVGKDFAKTLVSLLGKGDYVMQLTMRFSAGSYSPMWGDYDVNHAVACVGYTVDPTMSTSDPLALTGLFIIDSDNDQYTDGGGRFAPNTIVYCPVYWCSDCNSFEVEGLWGWTAEMPVGVKLPYKALQVQKPASVSVTFDGNGAEDYEKEVREYEVGEPYGEFPDVYRDESKYTFEGWWTAKTGGTRVYEDTPTSAKQTTVYARWEQIKQRTLKVSGGFAYDEDENAKTSVKLYPGAGAGVEFDYSKIYDSKSEQELGRFLYWTVSPETADLGSEFNPYDMYTSVEMPNYDVTLTAQYIPVVAAYVTIESAFDADTLDPDDYIFCCSTDKGKSWNMLDDGCSIAAAPGSLTMTFAAFKWDDGETLSKTSDWKAPADLTLTVPKLTTYKEDGITYYGSPVDMSVAVSFIEAACAKQVAFDANGGKVGVTSAWYRDGGTYPSLPEPDDRKGYQFGGWWTEKSGGESVAEGDVVDFSILKASKPTLYAHWLKAYTLTVKADGVTEVSVNGEVCTGSVSIQESDFVSLEAPEYSSDKSGNELVFSKWTLGKTVDLGDAFDAASCETSLVMPASDVTLTAKYRELYKKVSVSITGGFAGGESTTKTKAVVGDSIDLSFDYSKIQDKKGNETGAFQRWVVTPAGEDYGEDFDPFSPETTIRIPDADVKVTAQYVSTVAATVAYELGCVGDADEEAYFYWSPDKGKTLIPGGRAYPLGAGAVTVSFHAQTESGKASSAWKAPGDVKLTIPKRTNDGGLDELLFLEWFVAADDAVKIAFDANGGKCSVASRWYLDGGEYYTLPDPEARKGYVFDGWWTEKSGGESVAEGDVVDCSILKASKPTLYAHWRKAYTLTVKGEGVTATYLGETYESGDKVSVLQGECVELCAPCDYEKKSVSYYFQGWTPSKTYDLGEGFDRLSTETTMTMPAADVTMTASYVKASEAVWVCLYATAETVSAGDLEIEPDYSKFKWSVDGGKTWFPCQREVLLKKGTYTVQWGSDSGVWSAPTTKEKISLTDEYYSNEESPAVFTFAYAFSATAVEYFGDGDWAENPAAGTVTMNPADGKVVGTKTPAMTATPAKGYVFVGWQFEWMWDEYGLSPLSTQAKSPEALLYFYLLNDAHIDEDDYKIHLQAVFRKISDYTDEAMDGVFESVGELEVEYSDDGPCVTVPARVGCQTTFSVSCNIETYPLTMKVSGNMPKGVTFEEGYFAGTPTAAGIYDLKVTATDPAGHKRTLTVTLDVRELPDDIAGNFSAMLYEGTEDAVRPAGLAEVSITGAGKASAKITTASGTMSVTPTLSWYADSDDPEGEGSYSLLYLKLSSKSSKSASTAYAYFSMERESGSGMWNVLYEEVVIEDGTSEPSVSMSGTMVAVDRSLLSDSDFKAAFLGKYYTLELSSAESDAAGETYRTPAELKASGYLTLTVDKSGAVKYAGMLPDGEKVSGSATLLPYASDMAGALVFFTPSAYKKCGSFALELVFSEGSVSGTGSWVTPPLLDCPSDGIDVSEEDELFKPGLLDVFASGCAYSALSDLRDYYLGLGISSAEVVPTLEYTYTDGEKLKVYATVPTVLPSYYLSSEDDALKGGKNGAVTVDKGVTPWKDSEGCYHYDETKPNKYDETEPNLNPGGVTLSFKPATGIFSGKFNLFFDYEVPQYDKYGEETGYKVEHKSTSVSYEGVVISSDGASGYGVGSAQYSGKYTFAYTAQDKKGNEKAATKTYTQKVAMPVSWALSEP